MNDQPATPDFDDDFWSGVSGGVERVRAVTRAELAGAEARLLAAETEAEVVPVFPGPFWSRVNKRAGNVRRMALDELADAEERLMNPPGVDRARPRNRLPVPAFLRRLPPVSIPMGARINTLGFVTAVLAVLILLPQMVPIAGVAGVNKPRGPLAMFFSTSDEPPAVEAAATKQSSGPSAGTPERSASEIGAAATSNAGPAAGTVAPTNDGRSGESSTAGDNPAPSGTSATGAAGATSSQLPADAATPVITKPASPSNLVVTAVNDTTVRLRWKDNASDEKAVVIERNDESTQRRTLEADQKTYIWEGLPPGTEACFRVRARNEAGSSRWFPEDYRCVKTHDPKPTEGPVALQPLVCTNENLLPALPDLQETQIVFQNKTARTVNIYELGGDGVRELTPTTLAPGASKTINTFLGDPYVVAGSDEAASCLAIFLGSSWTSVATITEPAAT